MSGHLLLTEEASPAYRALAEAEALPPVDYGYGRDAEQELDARPADGGQLAAALDYLDAWQRLGARLLERANLTLSERADVRDLLGRVEEGGF